MKEEKFRNLLGDEWYEELKEVINSTYWNELSQWVSSERKRMTIYPEQGSELLFKAFRTTPLSQVRVVILGQDPYHDGSYDGFAFSNTLINAKKRISPSLYNILQEMYTDVYLNGGEDESGELFGEWLIENKEYVTNLEDWAKQGVLLINTAHTVRKGAGGYHIHIWKPFTREVIKRVLQYNGNSVDSAVVWMLWGKFAQDVFDEAAIPTTRVGNHLVLRTSHPSPYSAHQGFFGSRHFSKANEFLTQYGYKSINW